MLLPYIVVFILFFFARLTDVKAHHTQARNYIYISMSCIQVLVRAPVFGGVTLRGSVTFGHL